MTVELLTPILENGIRNIHYFHGRLLSAEDLREQQEADREHRRHLGIAIGAGIVQGLEVAVVSDGSADEPATVRVEPGLAINAKGDTLTLPQAEQVQLARAIEIGTDASIFRDCAPPETSQVPTGTGLYILVLSPASGFAERAPKSGIGTDGKVTGCGNRYEVEGVQLRLVQLKPSELSGIDEATRDLILNELLVDDGPASVSKLQNVVAHLLYGTEVLPDFAVQPFPEFTGKSPYLSYGAVDELRQLEKLNDCDVPLAVVYWTLDGIRFLDLWSVRRRTYTVSPSAAWPTLLWARRAVETEAMFLQFQEQLDALVTAAGDATAIFARDYFRYLPPAGFYPVADGNHSGVGENAFFSGKPTRGPEFLDGARLEMVLRASLEHRAIDLENDELIWLYAPWQNRAAASDDTPPVAVFAGPHLPHFSSARFDLARWEYSNYTRFGNGGI